MSIKIKKIEEKIEVLDKILLGARQKIVDDFKEDKPRWDDFITSKISEGKHGTGVKDMPLPYIYAFEILMAPVGYLSALSGEEKIKHEILESYQVSNILKEETGKTATKIFELLWKGLRDVLGRCSYDRFKPLPYGDAGNYDSMAWAFGFAVDALDLFKSGEHKYREIVNTLKKFLTNFFAPTEFVETAQDLSLIGYYFSPEISERIKDEIELIDDPSPLLNEFEGNLQARLVFALSNSSVLTAYNIVCDVIKDIEDIRAPYDLAGKNLGKLVERIKEDISKFKNIKNPDDFKEVYYHIFNFGILISISGLQGYSSVIKDNKGYLKEIMDLFMEKFSRNKTFRKTLEVEIPEIGSQKDKLILKDKFEINIAFPILIRSLVTLLKIVKKENIKIDVSEFEKNLDKSIDMFIKEYSSKEPGIFRIPGENDYDLALTNSAVEALTLGLGYYLKLWKESGEGDMIEVTQQEFKEFKSWKQSEENEVDEDFKTWKAFKTQLLKEFDERIDRRLKEYHPLQVDATLEKIIEEKVENHKTGDPKYGDRIMTLNKFLGIFEGQAGFKDEDDQLLKKIWTIVKACTLAKDTNDYENLESMAMDAVEIYYNPRKDQDRKDLIETEFKKMEKLKLGKTEKSKEDPA